MANKILVTPQKLKNTATQFNSTGNSVKSITNQMTSTVKSLTGQVWTGDAATAYTKKFDGLQDDINKFTKMISDHAQELEQIADNYEKAETENTSEANSLSSDVFA